MARLKLATAWLAGCSGCHMSFLDLDEWLIDLAQLGDIVYSPILDTKEYPHGVDFALIEGAVANEDNHALALQIRERTKCVVAFGDCAVTGNVTAMRNLTPGGAKSVLERCYRELVDVPGPLPRTDTVLPPLLPRVTPLHEVIVVDGYLPGCPPNAARIKAFLEECVAGRPPVLQGELIRFG